MAWDDTPPQQSEINSGWDAEPPKQGEIPEWSDLPKNIIPDAEAIGKGSLNTTGRIVKGVMDLPSDAVETVKDELGGNFTNTPIMQDAKTVGGGVVDAVKGIPQQLENLGSKDEWIKHPVGNTMTAASVVAPFLGGSPEVSEASDPNILQRMGAGAQNNTMGISADTMDRMAKQNNPIKEGVKLANSLREEGATAPSKMETLDNVKKLHDDAGDQVQASLKAIKEQNRRFGEHPEIDDALHVQANPFLKTVIDKANETLHDPDPELRSTGRKWKIMYDSLSDKAMENDGRLSFDDIRSEMKRVGHYFDSDKTLPIGRKMYAHLADMRDSMVEQVANESASPELADNLRKSNAAFSKYARILPDVRSMASKSATGSDSVLSGQRPWRAGMRAAEPALGKILLSLGNKSAKYGPMLKAAAAQGTKNLMMTDYLLKQSDQDYKPE